jgi:hypothetical protein
MESWRFFSNIGPAVLPMSYFTASEVEIVDKNEVRRNLIDTKIAEFSIEQQQKAVNIMFEKTGNQEAVKRHFITTAQPGPI